MLRHPQDILGHPQDISTSQKKKKTRVDTHPRVSSSGQGDKVVVKVVTKVDKVVQSDLDPTPNAKHVSTSGTMVTFVPLESSEKNDDTWIRTRDRDLQSEQNTTVPSV